MNNAGQEIPQKAKVLFSVLSAFISAVSFFYAYYLFIIDAYNDWILVIGAIVLLLCFILRKYNFCKYLSVYIFVFVILTFLSRHVVMKKEKENTQSELLADATMAIADVYTNLINNTKFKGWLPQAVKNEELVFVLLPPSTDIDDFCKNTYDIQKVRQDAGGSPSGSYRIITSNAYALSEKLDAYYSLAVLYTPHLKEDWQREQYIVLPNSAVTVLKGVDYLCSKDWELSRTFFRKANSLGNAAGTYYLAWMYEKGFGQKPLSDKSDSLYKVAADNGSREARFILGRTAIESRKSTSLDKEIGERYLRKAAKVNTIASINTIDYSRSSVKELNALLNATGRKEEAYKLTKACYEAFNNPYVKYVLHLENCVSCKEFEEALSIIREGEAKGVGYCFLVHAGLLTQGEGVRNKNLREAERLLRFAADSLDYYPAYKGLSELFREAKVEGSDLWDALYEVKYQNSVEYER